MLGIIPISRNDERSRILILCFRIFMIVLALSTAVELITAAAFAGSIDLFGMNMQQLVFGGAIVAIIRAINFILLAVFFIMWQRRAYHNLHKAGSRNLRYSEGWAAGAWWIPLGNLVMPYQIIRDIWNVTQNVFRRQGEDFEREQDNITGWWWAMFLASGFTTQASSFLIRDRDFESGYMLAAVGSIGYILAAFLAVIMVKRISAMETSMMERAHQYYLWVNEQQGQQFQQQQNSQNEIPPVIPVTLISEYDRYKPPGPGAVPPTE